jgi:5'-deoxynucleotidase YfbR-like HD superfamily hydrolase
VTPEILTSQGSYFRFDEPKYNHIWIEDIAQALSRICRFTGHTNAFYSVAQHSVFVSRIVPAEHALAGLLHDAAEAYLGDVSSPLKQLLPEYKAIEERVERAIFEWYGLPFPLPSCIKQADLRMLVTERRDLMPSAKEQGRDANAWAWTNEFEPLAEVIVPLSPDEARASFMKRFWEIY